ncbi:UDP-glycosyltransferase 76C4 [Morella rubra]|uniref:UDP-glycosyltransferase 76C4 n=1 Tax=Morella rubra TaxID=262757 RepID=A0A6A1W941_9ROSI|nr:UDP-glycosyltransferase 76C4 [Morella rubra]
MGLCQQQAGFPLGGSPDPTSSSGWKESLPEGFKEVAGERGCIVKWALQKEVLGHRAVATVVRSQSLKASVILTAKGIPMICQLGAEGGRGQWGLWPHQKFCKKKIFVHTFRG